MASATLSPTSVIARAYERQTLLMRCSPAVFGRRAAVVASRTMPPFPHAHAHHATERQYQPLSSSQLSQPLEIADQRQKITTSQISSTSSGVRPVVLALGSTTTAATAAMTAEAVVPTAFARIVVGAALALSTVYALLSSPASTLTSAAFSSPSSTSSSTSSDTDSRTTSTSTSTSTSATITSTITSTINSNNANSNSSATSSKSSPFAAAIATSSATATTITSLPTLRSPQQFDAFILASNRAGYLAIVLFHAPWCAPSQRMQMELQQLSHLFVGRRVVFARVDCSIKQGVRPGAPMGQVPNPGFKLQRCDLTQRHRIHKTPTMRMYYNNACVDEIVGCRPVDFRQAASDLTFKYNL